MAAPPAHACTRAAALTTQPEGGEALREAARLRQAVDAARDLPPVPNALAYRALVQARGRRGWGVRCTCSGPGSLLLPAQELKGLRGGGAWSSGGAWYQWPWPC